MDKPRKDTCKLKEDIQNPKSPHFWWLFGVLVVAVIILLGVVLTRQVVCASKILEFISHSSTLLSITLSVFAIQYTYVSNVQIQNQFEEINQVVRQLEEYSHNTEKISTKLDRNIDDILRRLEQIDETQKTISNQTKKTLGKIVDFEDEKG